MAFEAGLICGSHSVTSSRCCFFFMNRVAIYTGYFSIYDRVGSGKVKLCGFVLVTGDAGFRFVLRVDDLGYVTPGAIWRLPGP